MNNISASFSAIKGKFYLNIECDIPNCMITAITGASGAGKTTILRYIAGLDKPDSGYFYINNQCWLDTAKQISLPTEKRSIGYVFQDAALFPHLNVRQNLEYAYNRKRPSSHQINWDDVIKKVGLDHLLDRDIVNLSGGEKQRTAIARALLTGPDILLMDEPISALDIRSRYKVIELIELIHQEYKIPIIYVSHSIEEISRLAHRVICLENGKIIANGSVNEVLSSLDICFAYQDTAHIIIKGEISSYDKTYHLAEINFSGGSLFIITELKVINTAIKLQIYACDVSISLKKPVDTSILNIIPAVILQISPNKNHLGQYVIHLDANGTILLAHITKKSLDKLSLAIGDKIYAQIKSISIK